MIPSPEICAVSPGSRSIGRLSVPSTGCPVFAVTSRPRLSMVNRPSRVSWVPSPPGPRTTKNPSFWIARSSGLPVVSRAPWAKLTRLANAVTPPPSRSSMLLEGMKPSASSSRTASRKRDSGTSGLYAVVLRLARLFESTSWRYIAFITPEVEIWMP